MRVQFISDFHTEFFNFNKFDRLMEHYLPLHPEDSKTTLCCAGDMGVYSHYASTYKPLFAYLSKRFKHVIIVPGNHSWYNTAGVWNAEAAFWKDKKLPKNVHYLDNKTKFIDGVLFIGSCLWTDFNNSNPIAMFEASRGMNDFFCIKKRSYEVSADYGQVINSSRLQPEDTVKRFEESVDFIRFNLEMNRESKCVVITHHAPSYESIDEEFKHSLLNPAYASDLTDLMRFEPVVWCHGHMHRSKGYMVENTAVICNPLGYHAQDINKGFDPHLVLEI